MLNESNVLKHLEEQSTLKEASSALEEIIGKITTDDILNQIFENFCIGKYF